MTDTIAAIPETLVIFSRDFQHAQPDVTVDGFRGHYSIDNRIRSFFYNEIANPNTLYTAAPTGYLYTATGAHRLDAIFETMWHCPESEALRQVPQGGPKYREPHLTTAEQADAAYRRMWAEFRAALPTETQETTR